MWNLLETWHQNSKKCWQRIKFRTSSLGRVSHRCWEYGGGGAGAALPPLVGGGLFKIWWGAWVNTWGPWDSGGKYLWKSSSVSKVATYSLQACKFTKSELLHTNVSMILGDFKLSLLCFPIFRGFFLGIISWKGVSIFNGGKGGGVVSQRGGLHF